MRQKYLNQNFENVFYSFFCIRNIDHVCQLLRESEKTVRRVAIWKRFDDKHTNYKLKTMAYIQQYNAKQNCNITIRQW